MTDAMPGKPLETPVLLIVFNRPETTQRVFAAIRQAKPQKLFVFADGPRAGVEGEAERCQAARDIVQVDWPCEVYANFHECNLGLEQAVSTAIAWLFANVPEGIILEDDCLPCPSFFGFCQQLLERYRDDQQIMMISGDNFQQGQKRGKASYYFSRLATIWGWATWRRAWRLFDLGMATFPQFKEQGWITKDIDEFCRTFWLAKLQDLYSCGPAWDFAWTYTLLAHDGLCINPNANLVSNIGFGGSATSATNANSVFAGLPTVDMDMAELQHPASILPNREADRYFTELMAREQAPRTGFAQDRRGFVQVTTHGVALGHIQQPKSGGASREVGVSKDSKNGENSKGREKGVDATRTLFNSVVAQMQAEMSGDSWGNLVLHGDAGAGNVLPGEAWLLYGLVRALRPEHVLEIGTAYGYSTLHLAQAVKDNGKGKVWTVEIRADRQAEARRWVRSAKLEGQVNFLASVPTPEELPEIDFLFLDAVHTAVNVSLYLSLVKSRLTANAIIVMHDAHLDGHGRKGMALAGLKDWQSLLLPTSQEWMAVFHREEAGKQE